MLTQAQYEAGTIAPADALTGKYLVWMEDGSVKEVDFTGLAGEELAFYERQRGMVSFAVAQARTADIIDVLAENAQNIAMSAIMLGFSMVPGVGEGMDVYTVGDSKASWWVRGFAGGSIVLSFLTGGLSPNGGVLLRGGDDFFDAGRHGISSLETADYLRLVAGQTRAADDVFAQAKVIEHLRRLYPNRQFHVLVLPSLPVSGTLTRTGITTVDELGKVWIHLNGKLPLDRLLLAAEHEAIHVFQALKAPFWFNAVRTKWQQWIPGTSYKHYLFEWEAYGINHAGLGRFRKVAVAIWHEGRISLFTDMFYVGSAIWILWPSSKE